MKQVRSPEDPASHLVAFRLKLWIPFSLYMPPDSSNDAVRSSQC